MGNSLWQDTAILPRYGVLEHDEITDVLIIGGGMAGLLCAYLLQQSGTRYLLCEANTIASGTTAKTTAVLSAQHDIFYKDLIKKFGKEHAGQYLKANLEALAEYRKLSSAIDCDFEERPSYIYSVSQTEELKQEAEALRLLGIDAEYTEDLQLPVKIAGAVKFPRQAQFHPLKFLATIAGGLNIREHTQIKKIEKMTAYTGSHKIEADKIIIASHFPILNAHGMYFAKLYQKRSYILALEHAASYDGTYAENRENGMYFRNYHDLLLIGGGDHRTGKQGGNYEELRRFARRYYPHATEKYVWSTQDCMSLDGVPYIGQYSKTLPDVYVASGFNEWGMTTSMAAAKILTDLVLGKPNAYASVFNPSRSMITGQLFTNLGTTLIDYITPTKKRCPHMGCALKWNPLEHSWDCPCHGSRFEENGELIDNPATEDLHAK